jgi:hypothetical protein
MALAHWVNLLTFMLILPFIVAQPNRAAMLRSLVVGLAGGILVTRALTGTEPSSPVFAPVGTWPNAWFALAAGPLALLPWQGVALVAVVLGVAVASWSSLPSAVKVGVLTALITAVSYLLLVGTLAWVHANVYAQRYVFPSLLFVALAASMGAAGRLQGRWVPASVATGLAVVLAAGMVYVPSRPNVLRREMNVRLGPMTADVVSAGVTVIAGDYWTVWPAVFHANVATFRLAGASTVYGLSVRSGATDHIWRGRRVRVGIPIEDTVGLGYARGANLTLRFVERRASIVVYETE